MASERYLHRSMSPTILLAVLGVSLAASAAIAVWIVRSGRQRALTHLAEVPGPVRRSMAATSLGLALPEGIRMRGTGTLVLTDAEVAFAQWRPDQLVRISRPAIVHVDTARRHLGKTMNADLLRIRWASGERDDEDVIVFFVRDLDPWLADLGGTRSVPPPEA